MNLRTIRDIKDLRGKRVLLRVDANVPVVNGEIADDERLWAILPTLSYLSARGAVVVIIAHLGRPEGRRQQKFSLTPVAKRLAQISGKIITFLPYPFASKEIPAAISAAIPGQIFMLENLRFDRGEESNSGSFAKLLASFADIYVNDGFGVSHRAHASVSAVTRFLPSYAGFLMERELVMLGHVRGKPEKPSIAMIGGAKINTKIGLIGALAKEFSIVLIGGGLANATLAARGFGVGDSGVDAEEEKAAKKVLRHKNVQTPVDVVVGPAGRRPGRPRVVPVATAKPFAICLRNESIYDIGPRTILAWAGLFKKAKTIVWNGPVGLFEDPRYSHGTMALAKMVAARSKGRALGVVGGGETVEAVKQSGMSQYIDHISTGGGAMLEYLEGKILPGVKPLYGKLKNF
jgi:3-phosphoglycerate kinase